MISNFTKQQIQKALSILPQNWQLLKRNDLEDYIKLRLNNEEDSMKSKKGEKMEAFSSRLKEIKNYIERDKEDEWKRSIACGIIFLESGIAINIQNFKMLLSRCKSSINGSFQQKGYSTIPGNQTIYQEIIAKVPFFSKNPSELKKWTFREKRKEEEPKKVFIIELPKKRMDHQAEISQQKNLTVESIQKIVSSSYPCPVKYRYKFYDTIYHSVSIQFFYIF